MRSVTRSSALSVPLRQTRPAPASSRHPSLAPGAEPQLRLYDSPEAAAPLWRALETVAPASAYQSYAFGAAWARHLGAGPGGGPLIAVLADADGSPLALLPLVRLRFGPWRGATFLGGRMANYQMGLFHPGQTWPQARIVALLRDIARAAGLDGFVFQRQPTTWRGADNPLTALGGRPGPSQGHASRLPASFPEWRDSHYSREAQKKFRKKARYLAEFGEVEWRRPSAPADIEATLAAFLEQKSRRMRAQGLPPEFDAPDVRAFLRRASGLDGGEAAISWRALWAGQRIVSVFAGLAGNGRVSGLAISHDDDPAVARCSPGEQLLLRLVEDLIASGQREFDLGLGEARYKDETCEIVEPTFDSAFGVTPLGQLGAALFLAAQGMKGRLKRSPRALAFAHKLRRALRSP